MKVEPKKPESIQALAALRRGIQRVVDEAIRNGRTLPIYLDGKVVWIDPREFKPSSDADEKSP